MAFAAQYPGPCSRECLGIRPGDLIEYAPLVDGGSPLFRHTTCPAEPPPPVACLRCFMVPAVSGLCGCDE